MWSRLTGASAASQTNKDDDPRRRRSIDSTRSKRDRDRDPDTRSLVSSTSTRKPSSSRRDTAASSTASFRTALDDMAPRPRAPSGFAPNTDLHNNNSNNDDDRYDRRRDDRRSSYAESSASTMRDDRDRKKSKDKDRKTERRRSTRSERASSLSQSDGYRGDIVESPKSVQRSFSGQIGTDGFSQFPGQAGAPIMSGALPVGANGPPLPSSQQQSPSPQHPQYHRPDAMSSHVQSQFPGQDPAQYASGALPGGHPFGAAADYYNDQGQSVSQQPGVRPQPPSVIVGQDTPHLMAASAQPNPAADTGSGAAAEFYAQSTSAPSSSKPPRPSSSSMPGAFIEDTPAPQKPPRPASSSRPDKPSTFGSAATMAGGAALGYAMGHSSSSHEHSTTYHSSSNARPPSAYSSYSNNTPAAPASIYNMYGNGPNSSNSAANNGNYPPSYGEGTHGVEGTPPPKPPRPSKPEKSSSGSNTGLYAAGAAGLAAYGLHQHNSHTHSNSQSQTHSHTHSHAHSHAQSHASSHNHSTSGAPNGHHQNGIASSSYVSGGMAQHHQHTGPVSRFVDWWKDYEDVQKMEEYTEYIGVCKGCFDPRSSVLDAPRKHHYYKRRSSEYMRPSGGIEKSSRYNLKEKKSQSSISGEDRRKTSNSRVECGPR
ncbi:uncharacterized protein SETTUDRAFT_41985 [Exserohilum turcica Et28A]|uniref:Uncharacterized protein n=1 Tax=Exserohilum turcicum (strain 28A) TaxID=671987 RepID=R0IIJ1_EXST2|nr:uncharacterized protein SETTUDRAFT_41985 [Exserohilum turcica Et28A]EOA84751.1 hypothetical protein SETTUDRAFT_41985 [Exserohilum turcica Et28A]